MINKVTLIGNLGKDPDIRRLENGTAVASFSVATTESYKDTNGEWKDMTEWHNVVVWRGGAEYVEKHLKKGDKVYIDGKLSTRKYTDKNGVERYATEVVANVCKSLERKQQEQQNQSSQSTQTEQLPTSIAFDKPNVFTAPTQEINVGQKYIDKDGVILTVVAMDSEQINFQSTKVAGMHPISRDSWNKSIAPKYTLQQNNENASDLPF